MQKKIFFLEIIAFFQITFILTKLLKNDQSANVKCNLKHQPLSIELRDRTLCTSTLVINCQFVKGKHLIFFTLNCLTN